MRARPKPQARHWSAAEILRAVARELERARPGGVSLPVPRVVDNVDRAGDSKLVRLCLPPGVRHVRRWADALVRVDAVHLEPGASDAVYVHVVGRLPDGPMVELSAWMRDVELAVPLEHGERRPITLARLRELDAAKGGVR